MFRYIVRRFVQAVPIFFGITVLSYMLMLAAPGGPVGALTFDPRMTVREREAIAARLGVNDPWAIQYLRWMLGDDWMRWDSDGDELADHAFLLPLDADGDGEPEPPGERRGILRGDFGRSFFQRRPVVDVIVERIPATFELGISSLVFSLAVGIPIGILAAVKRGGRFDNFTRVMAVVFNAVPVFWLGLILILIFGSRLNVLPMGGRCQTTLTGGCPPLYERVEFLILPMIVLATAGIAGFSRLMRASMLEVISQDYVRTAHAKGLSPRVVWFKHSARNALIPIATFLGPALTLVLSGAAITETIFAWPGLGRVAVGAVIQRDYPVVMAVTIMTAVATILGYILSDIMYAVIDPRIRFR
jgi:peptide/nickel transport system permease protein